MATTKNKLKVDEPADLSVEERLRALYQLQQIDTKIDKIRRLRGELPLEVQDLEDEIQGLITRVDNYSSEIESIESSIVERKQAIKNAEALMKKYDEQQKNVRNNREFDSITKEIEYQKLEVESCEKKIEALLQQKKDLVATIEQSKKHLQERETDLSVKKAELDTIISETKIEEEELDRQSVEFKKLIDPRILTAYQRIRGNARNGLAVVAVQRAACGGCFNKIPPQRQLDIKLRKKILVCEYCGRILVDETIMEVNHEV